MRSPQGRRARRKLLYSAEPQGTAHPERVLQSGLLPSSPIPRVPLSSYAAVVNSRIYHVLSLRRASYDQLFYHACKTPHMNTPVPIRKIGLSFGNASSEQAETQSISHRNGMSPFHLL